MSNVVYLNSPNMIDDSDIIWSEVDTNLDNLGINPLLLWLMESFKSKLNDPYLLWTPDKIDINKYLHLKDRVWTIEWKDYIVEFILNTVKKNYSMNPDILPFTIDKNLEKCSFSEISEIIQLINIEIKRLKLPINTKKFLINIRNLAMQKNKEIIS